MPKLDVFLIKKCPKCGKPMKHNTYIVNGNKKEFTWCKDSQCRYAE